MNPAKTGPLSAWDPAADVPLYRQIYERFRGAIASGLLKPGDRIPSARALTQELGLARGTIEAAYALLAAEGYTQARGQAGTIVTPGLKPRTPPSPEVATARHAPALGFRPDSVLPFQMGLPALRAEIASYLQVSRGIQCAPSQVFLTSGYRHSIELIGLALLKAGDRVWLEDPGYPPTKALLQHLRMACVPVPVDADGLIVSEGLRRAPRARAAVVTPAHQSPLCVSLSLPRRMALLDWAARNQAWIVEDDYDGEYRYASRPLPALKSLDREGRVLYAGTFSKVLFPSIRLAYLVVPQPQVERFEQVLQTFAGGSPALTQAIVTAFIAEGHFARHIQRMRKLYAERRDAVRAGLEKVLGSRLRIDSPPGGMHLILRLQGRRSDRKLAARMREAGLYAEALTHWTQDHQGSPALLLGFTNIESRQAAEALGRRILDLM